MTMLRMTVTELTTPRDWRERNVRMWSIAKQAK
jgi:hypothetical protein